jgi:hypothetical protein
MKMTPFLSHWEEQRHLLVWVGLGRDRSFGDRIPIGKLMKPYREINENDTPFLSHWEEQRHLLVWVGLGRVGTSRLVIESLSGNLNPLWKISFHTTKMKWNLR